MRLHDLLYGSDLHRVFHHWWRYAEPHYVGMQDGRIGDKVTLYYDPLLDYHHVRGPESALMWVLYLAPQQRDIARRLYDLGVDRLRWRTLAPVREPRGNPRITLWGLVLAREFGDAAVYAKLKAHAEAHYEPTWEAETGEFTWGFGLQEPLPRGQFNASMMMAEALTPGAWSGLMGASNLGKFRDPTVYGVDFPTVCLSQAWYDVARRRLVIATDAGLPHAAGQPTSFRVTNLDPHASRVDIDGQPSTSWRVVAGDVEIDTTVGEHTIQITQQR